MYNLNFSASRLAGLPLHCAHVEYPNKLSQVLENQTELLAPSGKIHGGRGQWTGNDYAPESL